MWNRVDLKAKAKVAFNRNYWKCVLVSFVLLLVTGSGGSSASSGNGIELSQTPNGDFTYHIQGISEAFMMGMGIFMGILTIVALLVAVLASLLGIFVFAPIQVGGCRFFMENASENAEPGRLFFAFKKESYLKTVLTMFLKGLFTALWSLLFIIPGIYKSYEYRMIPYLLADCPDLTREEAFRISKEMMDGNKWEAFILDLSFLGWEILSAFTLGILHIFYVGPYKHATNAELFLELKREYFARRGQAI